MKYLFSLYKTLSPLWILLFVFFAYLIIESVIFKSNADDTALINGQLQETEQEEHITIPLYQDYNEEITQKTIPSSEQIHNNENQDFTVLWDNSTNYEKDSNNLSHNTTITYIPIEQEEIIPYESWFDHIPGSWEITHTTTLTLSWDNLWTGTEHNNNNDTKAEPSLITVQPLQQPSIDEMGRFDTTSLTSFHVYDEYSDTSYCSYITYLNLNSFLHTSLSTTQDSIVRWNAIDIWNELMTTSNTTLQSENTIFTDTKASGDLFVQHIDSLYKKFGDTLIDVVTKNPTSPDGSTIRQSHRFTILYASDEQRYVLDPVRTNSQEPIILSDYLATYLFDHEDIAIVQSYNLTKPWTFLDIPLLQGKDIKTIKGQQELIQHIASNNNNINSKAFRGVQKKSINSQLTINSEFMYIDDSETIAAYIPNWLTIQTANGNSFDLNSFVIQEEQTIQDSVQAILDSTITLNGNSYTFPTYVGELIPSIIPVINSNKIVWVNDFETQEKTEWWVIKTVKFWQLNEHLIFSEPVPLLIQVPDSDGKTIEIQVHHEGQEWFTTDSLSTNPNTQCSDGVAQDQSNVTTVQSGIVTIYTCGASTFTFSYTGGANTTHYIDNGTKDFSITIATGAQFDTGALINDINIGINFRPIDNESATWPRWTTNCYPAEKSFILIHPDGTQVALANPGTYTTPNTNCPQAQITYDQEAISPIIGWIWNLSWESRQPVWNISTLYNKSPFGTWTIRAWDNAWSDWLLLFWFNLNVDASAPICGDGIIQSWSSEQCDDGNTNNSDGCSLTCQIESWRQCSGSPSSCSLIPSPSGLLLQYNGSTTWWWLFTDISGNGNNATAFNGVTTANQNGETVMCFNGTNQYLERVWNLVTSYPFTMSSWVRANNTTGLKGVMSYARSTATNIMYNNELNTTTRRQNAQNTTARYTNGTTAANTTEWFLVTSVFTSPTNRQIYVNGVLQGTNTVSTIYDTNVNKRLNIGRLADSSPSNYFGWCIDDIRFYGNSLTSWQVYSIYAKPATLTTSLVYTWSPLLTGTLQWPLDRISLTISGNSYTGINHGNGTWSLSGWLISPSLGTWLQNAILTVTNPYNRSVQYSGSFMVELPIIAPWDLCIAAPNTLHIWSITGSNTWQIITQKSDYFTVDDKKGSLSGYYTTLSISDLTSTWSLISKSNIQVKADPITTLSWSANPAVILDSTIVSFTSLSSPVTFIKRNNGTWWGIQGIYWSKINLQITIPAYQTIGTYTGTLTYTLYEN